MPSDLLLCPGEACPLRNHCLRYTATIFGRQDFFGRAPYRPEEQSCKYFLDERPTPEAIAPRAHELWERAGAPPDRSIEHWLAAEAELIERRRNGL